MAQGLVQLSSELMAQSAGRVGDDAIVFEDQLDGQCYRWSRDALNHSGPYVKIEKGAAHILRAV